MSGLGSLCTFRVSDREGNVGSTVPVLVRNSNRCNMVVVNLYSQTRLVASRFSCGSALLALGSRSGSRLGLHVEGPLEFAVLVVRILDEIVKLDLLELSLFVDELV